MIDERAIQLEFGEGQQGQLLHGGVAGTEVIDGEAETVHAQARQHLQRLAQILHERALGHLQGDELGIDAPALALVDQGVAQIPLDQRGGREVHREVEG